MNLILLLSRKVHRPVPSLLKGPQTMQKEIKKTTIAYILKIVETENDDWTLWECILLPW